MEFFNPGELFPSYRTILDITVHIPHDENPNKIKFKGKEFLIRRNVKI